MPIGGTFGSILSGLSLLDKDNARDAKALERQKEGDKAASERQSAGDAAALARMLKSLEHAKDQAYLDRGHDIYQGNTKWVREFEEFGRRQAAAEAEAERDRELRRELQGSEFQHREKMPMIESDAQTAAKAAAEANERYNRLNRLRSLGITGKALSYAMEPELAGADRSALINAELEKDPRLGITGVPSALARGGYFDEDEGPFDGAKKPGQSAPRPLGNLNR